MNKSKKIAVAVERSSAYGRKLISGVAEIAERHPDWDLTLIDPLHALDFIRSNAVKGISASDVFRHVGFSRTLVEKIFNENTSSPVQKKIVEARIDEAKRLLSTTSIPVKEVATLSGFSSLHYLSRAFASATGRPPTAWREQNTT